MRFEWIRNELEEEISNNLMARGDSIVFESLIVADYFSTYGSIYEWILIL